MLELLEALELAASRDFKIRCVLIGSKPGFDETSLVEKKLRERPWLRERVMLLPECSPDDVWGNLCAGDIFAFPSHHEGMPNSLLEAMAMGLPAVAFAIPPVREIDAGIEALVLVPPLDSKGLADAMLHLAASPDERAGLGEKGKQRVRERFMVKTNMAEAVRRVAMSQNERPSLRARKSA
jgi:glycosyltransferase involved in cell wall biosynthesis